MWKAVVTCTILLGCSAFVNCEDNFENSYFEDEDFVGKGDHQPCGQNGTGTMGTFSLNNNNFTGECVWSIVPNVTAKTTVAISLFIHFLYLHDGDVVTVFKNEADVVNDSLSIIKPLRVQNGTVTVKTAEKELLIKLTGNPKVSYTRVFKGAYHSADCNFQITPDLQIINSPIPSNYNDSIECTYTYNHDPHYRKKPTFIFEKFNMASSTAKLSQSTLDGPYSQAVPVDFFPSKDLPMSIDVTMGIGTNDTFRLRMHMVDSYCSDFMEFSGQADKIKIGSPMHMFNNGSITVFECRYVIKNPDSSKILGVTFEDLYFDSALDIIAINDGASELSPPLLQVTTSNGNITKNQVIRSTGPSLWIAFKLSSYASRINATIDVHAQGGYHKGNGSIKVTPGANDPVFLLEVEENQIVQLLFNESDIPSPATLNIYDGFDKTNLLASLQGNVWYPIISKSNKMMLIASDFAKGQFIAEFKGVSASCLHMSSLSDQDYILSGNCNNTCFWVIPPQKRSNTDLLLDLQFLDLGVNDTIEILKLDAAKTILGQVSSNVKHVPQLMIPANVGALVEITRGVCSTTNDIVVVGHSSYLPACGKDLSLSALAEFQIFSPLHPDTYPVFAGCRWKISTAKDNLVHFAFHSLNLAPNHCVKIIHSSDNKTVVYEGGILQEDLFLTGESVVQFDSGNCKEVKPPVPLLSSEGFVLNGTVSDCGSVLSGKKSGTFTVSANKSLCLWKVSIPETGEDANDAVNIISYSVSKKDDLANYELHVYDGSSVRDSKIVNDTNTEIWSRTSNLIFLYKRVDAAKPSTILTITYDTISCNSTMQCANKMCMHPDWRCNGVNDCGDFTDERNCNAVPIPPTIELMGYSSTTFWVTIFVMLALGGAVGFGVPICYQKYRNGQYRRFGEISIIE